MNQQSKLLRVILLATLGVSANAHAISEDEDVTDLDRVRAVFPDPETYNNTYDGFFGGTSSYDDSAYNRDVGDLYQDPPDPPTCEEVLAMVPDGCDVANPPKLTTNGCGGGPTASIVPDSLVIGYSGYLAMSYDNVFTGACDTHDLCYATAPGDKGQCDVALTRNMLAAARNRVPPRIWLAFGDQITNQINGYDAFFKSSAGSALSMIFFNSAQKEDICRSMSDAANAYCRSFQ